MGPPQPRLLGAPGAVPGRCPHSGGADRAAGPLRLRKAGRAWAPACRAVSAQGRSARGPPPRLAVAYPSHRRPRSRAHVPGREPGGHPRRAPPPAGPGGVRARAAGLALRRTAGGARGRSPAARAQVPAGRGAGRRGRALLSPLGHRSRGRRARRLRQREERAHRAGREHDPHADREEPLPPRDRAHLVAQDPRGPHGPDARPALLQGPHPRGLPERGLPGPAGPRRRVRGGRRRAFLLRPRPLGPHPGRVGAAGRHAPQSRRVQPLQAPQGGAGPARPRPGAPWRRRG